MTVAEEKEHVVSVWVYLVVLALLMLLLAATIAIGFVDVDRVARQHGLGSGWNTAIAVAIAIVKGTLILLFFMHVRYGTKLTWAFASAGFVWLGIMIVLMMSEYMTRNHPPDASSKGEPRYFQSQ